MAVTAACSGGGGGPSSSGADATQADFVEVATLSLPEIHLASGDVDNDGDTDLYMIADPGGPVSSDFTTERIARNDGTGTLVPGDEQAFVQGCTRPRLEGIDADAYLDVVCVPGVVGGASARLNQGGTSFVNAGYDSTSVTTARAWPVLPSTIVAASSGGLLVLAIAPYSMPMAKTTLAADQFATLAVADLDGDGKPELIAGTSATWSVFSGADQSRHDYAGEAGDLDTADMNRDGHPDLLAFSDATVAISLVSSGALSAPVVISGPPAAADHFVVDYDGDGISDVLFIGVGPQVYVMRGDGAGSLHPPEPLTADGAVPAYMTGRNLSAVADFDRDGKIDLAISDVQTHTVRIYKGR
jgi:hypothetical protein